MNNIINNYQEKMRNSDRQKKLDCKPMKKSYHYNDIYVNKENEIKTFDCIMKINLYKIVLFRTVIISQIIIKYQLIIYFESFFFKRNKLLNLLFCSISSQSTSQFSFVNISFSVKLTFSIPINCFF